MGDDDQRDAPAVEFFQQAHHFLAGGAVEVAGRFVGEQHGRLHDRGAGDGDALALAAGELVRTVSGAVGEAVVMQRALDAPLALGRRDAGEDHRQGDVLGRGQARHQVEALEDEADALAAHARLLDRRERRHVAPFEPVGAGVGAVEQAEQVEQRRLARAGRPHDRDVLARGDGEVELAQRMHFAVAQVEDALDAGERDQRPVHHRPCGFSSSV